MPRPSFFDSQLPPSLREAFEEVGLWGKKSRKFKHPDWPAWTYIGSIPLGCKVHTVVSGPEKFSFSEEAKASPNAVAAMMFMQPKCASAALNQIRGDSLNEYCEWREAMEDDKERESALGENFRQILDRVLIDAGTDGETSEEDLLDRWKWYTKYQPCTNGWTTKIHQESTVVQVRVGTRAQTDGRAKAFLLLFTTARSDEQRGDLNISASTERVEMEESLITRENLSEGDTASMSAIPLASDGEATPHIKRETSTEYLPSSMERFAEAENTNMELPEAPTPDDVEMSDTSKGAPTTLPFNPTADPGADKDKRMALGFIMSD